MLYFILYLHVSFTFPKVSQYRENLSIDSKDLPHSIDYRRLARSQALLGAGADLTKTNILSLEVLKSFKILP
jgi:hypothetical protein